MVSKVFFTFLRRKLDIMYMSMFGNVDISNINIEIKQGYELNFSGDISDIITPKRT